MTTCVNKGNYLWVEVSEAYSLKYILSTIHEVADHCRADKLNKALIDVRNMEGNPKIFDRFQIGLEIVRSWGPRLKVAVVAKPNVLSRMIENTAVNRGARLFTTSDVNAAFKWLELEIQGKEEEHTHA